MTSKQAVHLEIPGYYYDERRRRYFRCPPKQQIPNNEPLPASISTPTSSLPHPAEKTKQPGSFHEWVMRRQYDSRISTSNLYECIASSLKRKMKLVVDRNGTFEHFENIAINHLGNILVKKSTTPSFSCCDHGIAVVNCRGCKLYLRSIFFETSTCIDNGAGTSRSLDFLPPVEDGTESLLILHSPREILFKQISLQIETVKNSITNIKSILSSNCVKLKEEYVCTAMWNKIQHTQESLSYFIGCDDGTIQLRNLHKKLVCLKASWKSPVLSLGCDHSLLYTGYRNGCINVWDLRAKSRCVWNVKEPANGKVASSVIGLHPLTDGNYFVSNAFNSNLSLWDMRMKFKTLSFKGHTNTFKNCKSIIDRAESFVAAAGSDQCVRLWSLRFGETLQTIEHADYSDKELPHHAPPAISYTENLGGRHGNPELLIAYEGTLTAFGINTSSYDHYHIL